MTRRLKIIMFPLGVLLAHVGRVTEIAKALRDRGHEVLIAGEDPDKDHRSKLGIPRAAGFQLIYAREPDYRYVWNRYERYGWVVTGWDLLTHQWWAPLDEILEEHVQLIEREKPDLVVGDATVTVSTAAHILGIPAAGVMNAYNTRFLSPGSVFMPLIRAWDKLHLARIRSRVYRKYGVKQEDALGILRELTMISPDLSGLFPNPAGWPHWHTVGPIISEPTDTVPDWYEELDDGTPNVYLTMGSTGFLNAFLNKSYDALGRMPYRFLLTTGGQASPETLARAPKNFRIATYASGSKLLEKSIAMVFHGGNGTMYQGLAAGVPMVALPCHVEQVFSFSAGVRCGFGVQLPQRRVSGKSVAAALERVIAEPGFRAESAARSEAVRNSRGPERAAEILEACALEGRIPGA